MYILVLFLPLISSCLCCLLGRYIGRQGSAFISVFLLFLTWIIALFIYFEICYCHTIVSIQLYNWLQLDIYNINIGFLFDPLSSSMILIVITISMLVHLYSIAYMSHDPYLTRFMGYLSLFTFCMLLLVTSDIFYNYL
jgi:NADH:ubiquinone oxidoreductase subunit 5 (subunit L)/multisubunit Na+/H+ antiporter MnhA subunit